jgi:pimeloyl-ACP methyl ester carboxylesterase
LANFADDLSAFLEARMTAPVPVGGISMGAALALRLAIARPDLVTGLILVRPAWVCDPAPPNLAPYVLCGELLARHSAERARTAFDASPIARRFAEEAPDNVASFHAILAREPRAVTSALLSRIATDGPGVAETDLVRLHLPTVVIGQEHDLAHPIGMAEQLVALIPGARLVRVTPKGQDRAQHSKEVRLALANFLSELT